MAVHPSEEALEDRPIPQDDATDLIDLLLDDVDKDVRSCCGALMVVSPLVQTRLMTERMGVKSERAAAILSLAQNVWLCLQRESKINQAPLGIRQTGILAYSGCAVHGWP